jgi:Ca2+-binding RTX toxin-like protein
MTFTYTGTSGDDRYDYPYNASDSLLAYGLAGNDTLTGGRSSSTLVGGAGNDSLYAYGYSVGRITILRGSGGDDTLTGDGELLLKGGAGNDYLWALKSGDSTLVGGIGNDTLYGTNFNNYLVGGAGNDILHRSNDNDTLTGGTGADRFELAGNYSNNEYAIITDFRRAQGDKIQVYGSASNFSLDKSQNLSGQLALDTAIYYSNILIAVLQDTTIASLSSDFIFG